MEYFTQEDHDWFERVSELPELYKIVISNNHIWVEDAKNGEIPYRFNFHGCYFVYALLKDMEINVEFY